MAEKNQVHAPYNFVPFSNRVLVRYEDMSELPPHDKIIPSLKTGEIHVTLTADTPVFVSNGKKQEKADFFRGANGKYTIPGSTVRGMTRQNMQILGFGLMRPGEDIEDIQIFYREMAAARASTGDKLKQYYHEALDIKAEKNRSGKNVATPRAVAAGYLRKKMGTYVIQPAIGEYFRVSRKHPDNFMPADTAARAVPISYTVAEGIIKKIRSGGPFDGMERGMLLFTGKPVGRIPNSLYVIPAPDESADPIEISKEDILSYEADWEDRRNSLKAYYDPNFWALPKEGEEKPVFYIRHEGHTYFGMSRFLRIGYRYPLTHGLPQRHKDAEVSLLDYPYSILGFAGSETAYRSRVSFGDFEVKGTPKTTPPVKIVLGNPKPSYYPGYAKDGKHYNEEDFQLRGHKQYWLKEEKAVKAEKEKVASWMHPLEKGTKFQGVIRYRNLHEDELGLLLWSLRLEDGCYQSIGMGKPYGYGRMKLTIDELQEYDFTSLYSADGLCKGPTPVQEERISTYIAAYESFAEKLLASVGNSTAKKKKKKNQLLREKDEIKDFFFIRSTIRKNDETSYMQLNEYKNQRNPLEEIKTVREATQNAEPSYDSNDIESMKAQLLRMYGSKH